MQASLVQRISFIAAKDSAVHASTDTYDHADIVDAEDLRNGGFGVDAQAQEERCQHEAYTVKPVASCDTLDLGSVRAAGIAGRWLCSRC